MASSGNSEKSDTAALGDVKQLGLWPAIASLGWVFWCVGGMEMVERCAYYGVRQVTALYATAAQSKGGLGIDEKQLGTIFLVWAGFQTIVPAFTGGLSDRYGYKETIFVSTFVKIAGYLLMALVPSYWGFLLGALVLATGTAIFKPGIQGTLINATSRDTSSMAWGIFYQTVNIGGWIGPLIGSWMRTRHSWESVFFINSGIIALNFLLLLTYKEPKKAERIERIKRVRESRTVQPSLWRESVQELRKKHVWTYLAVFSGFWFMFNSLFDILPLHVRDWVETKSIVTTLFGPDGTKSVFWQFVLGLDETGKSVNPEGMLNLNSALIMTTCFLFAYVSGRMRATTSMVIGTLLVTGSLYMAGYSMFGWISFAAIMIFSVGEMLSSPKFSEFIGNFAPVDKKAMYIGFSQIPIFVGWTFESYFGPWLYGTFASKENFARELLIQRGMDRVKVDAINKGEAFDTLVKFTGESPEALTQLLHSTHNVGLLWLIMAIVGAITAVGIYAYGRWARTLSARAQE